MMPILPSQSVQVSRILIAFGEPASARFATITRGKVVVSDALHADPMTVSELVTLAAIAQTAGVVPDPMQAMTAKVGAMLDQATKNMGAGDEWKSEEDAA